MAWTSIGNIRGPAGLGVPPGGSTGQVLTKTSGADNATAWQTPSAPATNLNALTDVTIASPTNGQLLTYESASSQWKNKTKITVAGSAPSSPVVNDVWIDTT